MYVPVNDLAPWLKWGEATFYRGKCQPGDWGGAGISRAGPL